MATIDDLITDAQRRMDKSVEHARNEFNTRPHRPRVGRAARPHRRSTTTARRRRCSSWRRSTSRSRAC